MHWPPPSPAHEVAGRLQTTGDGWCTRDLVDGGAVPTQFAKEIPGALLCNFAVGMTHDHTVILYSKTDMHRVVLRWGTLDSVDCLCFFQENFTWAENVRQWRWLGLYRNSIALGKAPRRGIVVIRLLSTRSPVSWLV